MPRLPSSSSAVPHRPAAGNPFEDRPFEHRRAAAAGERERGRRHVDAERHDARAASASTCRPGPHPMSSTGPSTELEQSLVGRGRGLHPAPAVEAQHAPGCAERDVRHDASRTAPAAAGSTAATAAANRDRGTLAATASASAKWSTSRSSGQLPGAEPDTTQLLQLRGTGGGRAHRHADEDRGSRVRQPEPPPAAVGCAVRGPRRPPAPREPAVRAAIERAGELGRVHPDEERGPVDRGEGREPAGLRAHLRPGDGRRTLPAATVRPDRRARARAGEPAPRRPSPACRRAPLRRSRPPARTCTAGRVGSSPGPAVATWRARPASRRAGSPQDDRHVVHRAHGAGEGPVTFDRPMRGRYCTGRSSMRHPALAARSTISSGQPDRRSVDARARAGRAARAARIGPRSVNRITGPPAQLEGQHPVGHARVQRPAPRAAACAEHEVGAAVEHRCRDLEQVIAAEASRRSP